MDGRLLVGDSRYRGAVLAQRYNAAKELWAIEAEYPRVESDREIYV